MARFDVFELEDGILVVDCQSDLLESLHSRFVIPLFQSQEIADAAPGFNPEFFIDGTGYRLFPQGAATLPRGELSKFKASLAGDDHLILGAIDVLVSGICCRP